MACAIWWPPCRVTTGKPARDVLHYVARCPWLTTAPHVPAVQEPAASNLSATASGFRHRWPDTWRPLLCHVLTAHQTTVLLSCGHAPYNATFSKVSALAYS